MNRTPKMFAPTELLYLAGLKARHLLPRQRCQAFGSPDLASRIERIYVINLDRQPDRWREMKRELNQMLDAEGNALTERTVRFSAVDAREWAQWPAGENDVQSFYTLRDQLFVEPQPSAVPNRFELDRPIEMSRPEVAVARSHIGVWRRIAGGEDAYALVLEDDTWFSFRFARYMACAWRELAPDHEQSEGFEMLYLSYKEVKGGAQKTQISRSVFRPVRGLWYLSGYVLSRGGARRLLGLLPCRGPVDLWMNRQMGVLDVRATRQSIISQRADEGSTNSYSILPTLSRIGVLDCEGQSLFQIKPQQRPVFAFGEQGSGLSSLAMALSMLGYRCCSDLQALPGVEEQRVLSGSADRVFDAYVNIGSLEANVATLRKRHPEAKFLVTGHGGAASTVNGISLPAGLTRADTAVVRADDPKKWKVLCEHLRCAPPICAFPDLPDLGQRPLRDRGSQTLATGTRQRHDASPWVVERGMAWRGIWTAPTRAVVRPKPRLQIDDGFEKLASDRWLLRSDTFSGNLGLFRPANVQYRAGMGAVLSVRREQLGVREYSAAAISSRKRFLFGRFEATLQASNVPGVITGFFLHRNSPRQEIDIEIVGNRPNRLLVNVFYNPGGEGANYDYGYRGTPSIIELGFDASKCHHRFAIVWEPDQIRWFVDGQLIHERVNWDPTPIPRLPMTLHANAWPSRSRELAGRLARRRLPTTTILRSIEVEASVADS